MSEEWRWVVGFENSYMVSSFGRIKSVDRYRTNWPRGKRLIKGMMLNPALHPNGYRCLVLGDEKGNRISHWVHRIVGESFIPNPHRYKEINHKDGNKENNKSSNLEWCSPKQNTTHARLVLRSFDIGSKHPESKLHETEVSQIKGLLLRGESGSELARLLNVSPSTISKIKRGLVWNYIPPCYKQQS